MDMGRQMMPHTPTADNEEEEEISVEEVKGEGRRAEASVTRSLTLICSVPFRFRSPRRAVGRGGGDGNRRRLLPSPAALLLTKVVTNCITLRVRVRVCHSFLSFAALHGMAFVQCILAATVGSGRGEGHVDGRIMAAAAAE